MDRINFPVSPDFQLASSGNREIVLGVGWWAGSLADGSVVLGTCGAALVHARSLAVTSKEDFQGYGLVRVSARFLGTPCALSVQGL